MGTFDLITFRKAPESDKPREQERLGSAVLLQNALWFTKLRWFVVFVFIATGLAGILMPGIISKIGFVPPAQWPWILAGILILANTLFYILVRRLNEESPRRAVVANIWLQFGVDLMVVTALVYIIGCTDTSISFVYLFHIVLASIFFEPRNSLLVTFIAAGFYILCVSLEITGVLPAGGILENAEGLIQQDPTLKVIFAGSAVFVWIIVWYLVSTLSMALRKRDRQLSVANEQLIRADQEKTQQVLSTTHELKAPFAGIESNIQVLKCQCWNELPESARDIIDRIEERAQVLSERIREILILGDLRSNNSSEVKLVPVDLRSVMDKVLDELEDKALSRRILLDIQVPSITVFGNMKHLTVLFCNLVANAILYSYEGGRVNVSVKQEEENVHVAVSDQGIGIRDDALAHIFDDYFRTKEGAKFNRMSTGLGLAIVKKIAQKSGLRISVTSEQEKGTTFQVAIPRRKGLTSRGG